jgi:uncharacterized protein (TIGR03382 family)
VPVVDVGTTTDLIAAISNAHAGDEIVLADGTYALTGVSCSAVGTEAAPITVRAANPLGAHIELDALEGFKVSGAYWHFEGLDVKGVCASDPNCEHAFHVTGAADGFVLRSSRVRDFNAQLKVNAAMINGSYVQPNRGLIEYNELGDTRGRNTSNPVTKLNIDTGDDWIIRGNYIHDAYKMGGDGISYATFMKSGGHRGLIERNLVVCSKDTTGGTRIGLSFGGGGTGAQYCAPAYDPNVPCSIEHTDGTMRNNIIANCSDVGIYINRGKNSHILYNTLIATSGVDFRFDTTTGEAVGNVMAGTIHLRDSGTATKTSNLEGVTQFAAWYQAPLAGDLKVIGDVSSLIGAGPTRADVPNDYCGATRPTTMNTLGAIEHSVANGCETTMPPMTDDPDPVTPDGGMTDDGDMPAGDGGCCSSTTRPSSIALAFGVLALLLRRRRH